VALPDAVLFDLDGTLVDTEPYWIDAEHELASAHGARWTHDDAMSIVGMALLDAAAVLRAAGIPMTEPEIVDQMVGEVCARLDQSIPWQPGARELLAELAAAGVPCGLVTMSYAAIADRIVAHAPPGAFGAVVTGDTVRQGKPHPEPYLTAAAKLGVAPDRCVAIEDSPTGLASATAAGARPLAIPHIVPIPASPGLSRAPSLVAVTPDTLAEIAAGTPVDLLA
jgi:HAD superfamily hydrolase (TIGR01509 family)